jgi:sugar phosphate isomerase/epimerase
MALSVRLGYMPSFQEDPLSEIEFAKKHFDFIEITLKTDPSEYSEDLVRRMKKELGRLEVYGHLHWGIDLSKRNVLPSMGAVYKTIGIYKTLGAEKITIHPSSNENSALNDVKANNLSNIFKINSFCKKDGIGLLVENTAGKPFNKPSLIREIVNKVPGSAVTLDIGHANRSGELHGFLELSRMIKHVHLHCNRGERDHLPFGDGDGLEKNLDFLESMKYSGGITLEMFYCMEGSSYSSMSSERRKEVLIEQAEKIRLYESKKD